MSKKWPRVDKLVKQLIRQVDREMDWKEAELLASAHCDRDLIKSGWSPGTGRVPRGQHWHTTIVTDLDKGTECSLRKSEGNGKV